MPASTIDSSPSGLGGLTAAQAADRLAADGPNALPATKRRTLLHIALEAAREPMFLLLIGGALLYLMLGEMREGAFLMVMVVLTLGLTLYQEGKTERALDALRELASPRALVVRDGQPLHIDSRAVVLGDVIVVAEGDRVPADADMVAGHELAVDESLLTGESVAVEKSPEGADAATRRLYAGTVVVKGHARAHVVATGARSQIGAIGQALQNLGPERSPLQRHTARMVAIFAILGLSLSALLVPYYGLRHGDWMQGLLAGIALAMSMLPQEFTVVLAVFPALGAWRLSRANVLTRRLSALETMGATSVLCVDKTGTLTENRMAVVRLLADGAAWEPAEGAPTAAQARLAELAILASAPAPFDPMERAIHTLAARLPTTYPHMIGERHLAREYALSSQQRSMAQAWRGADGVHLVAAKGAPEAIFALCQLDAGRAAQLEGEVEAMAADGLRVLGVACARWQGEPWPATQHGFAFEFAGLVALADPLRADVPEQVAQCHQAGIRLVMITGDYPATAQAIARQAGIDSGRVISGAELAALDDAALRDTLRHTAVCARIAPDQKLRIVQALKAGGAIVGMTGDGVNDAPALRAAHVGVAMGQRGTDVAREAAALVLLDDRFGSIVAAVRAGRALYNAMQRAMSYILSVHVGIAGMALLPLLLDWPVLLYPMHIVFIQLLVDPACALAFENEPPEPDLMRRAPRSPDAPLFGARTMAAAMLQGVAGLTAVMLGYAWALQALPQDQARAFAFAALIVSNLAQIFSNRSHSRSALDVLRAPNPMLWAVSAGALTLLLLALYLPPLAAVFRFAPLSAMQLLAAAGIGMSTMVWFELLKFARRRRTTT